MVAVTPIRAHRPPCTVRSLGAFVSPAFETRMFSTIEPRFAIRSSYERKLSQARPMMRTRYIAKAATAVATTTKNRPSNNSSFLVACVVGPSSVSSLPGWPRTLVSGKSCTIDR